MVACGAFLTDLTDPVAVALIVVGAGMFFIGMLLPTLTEFQIGPGGFSAKLRERDEEIQATLDPDSDRLLQIATQLAGSQKDGEQLLERALVDIYMKWSRARREGPADAVLEQLRNLAPKSAQATPSAPGEQR